MRRQRPERKQKDWNKIGVIIGLGIFAAITIVGLALGGSFSLLTLLRLVTVIICSVAGSVFGVNRAGKKKNEIAKTAVVVQRQLPFNI